MTPRALCVQNTEQRPLPDTGGFHFSESYSTIWGHQMVKQPWERQFRVSEGEMYSNEYGIQLRIADRQPGIPTPTTFWESSPKQPAVIREAQDAAAKLFTLQSGTVLWLLLHLVLKKHVLQDMDQRKIGGCGGMPAA